MQNQEEEPAWIAEARRLLSKCLSAGAFEQDRVEWKLALPTGGQRQAQHLSAFANLARGGYLVLGIENDGTIRGITAAEADAARNQLAGVARDGLEPPISGLEFSFAPLSESDDRRLLFVRVPAAARPPVKLKGKSIEESYIRAGAASRRMTTDELREAFRRAPESDPLAAIPAGVRGSAKDLLGLADAVDKFRPTRDRSVAGLLRSAVELGFAAELGGVTSPTGLGVVMAAAELGRFPGFDRMGVRMIRYPGDSRVTLDGAAPEEARCAKGLLFAVDSCLSFLRTAGPRIERLRGALRTEDAAIPEPSLREALINALVHRDYSRNEPVTVEAFRSRIEITSPGGLLAHQTAARVLDQPPRARNQKLYDSARLAGLVESRGRGIDLMVAKAEEARIPGPMFRDDGESFKVVFEGPKPFDDYAVDERVWNAELHVALAYEDRRPATNATLRERFGLAPTPSNNVAVSRLLARCVALGRIRPADPTARTRAVRYVPAYV